MKTTLHSLVGWMALATVLWARVVVAGPSQGTLQSALGAAVVGQSASTGNPADNKDQQVADLLHRARQAMAENDLEAADSLIAKAESLGVQYGPFYMGDTPKRARHDLERKRNAAAATPAKPSGLFSPLGPGNSKAPSTDPFAARRADPQPPAYGADLRPLPRVDGTSAGQAPMDRSYPMTQPGQGDVRAPGSPPVSPLRAARLALAVGDVRRADGFVGQAKAMRLNYQPQDDTPEQVETAIRKYQELSGLDKNSEAYARMYARSMMDQADGLARWSEFDEAERLAGRAAGIRIVYGPFEQKPQELLQRIAAARRGQRPQLGSQVDRGPPCPRPQAMPPRPPAQAMPPRRPRRAMPRIGAGPHRRHPADGPSSWSARPVTPSPAANSTRPRAWLGRPTPAAPRRRLRTRRPPGPGADGYPPACAGRAARASSPPAGSSSFRPEAPANPTTTLPAPTTTRIMIRRATCRPAASSRRHRPIRGWRRGRTAIRRRRSRLRRPARTRAGGAGQTPGWPCFSRARMPCGPTTPTAPSSSSARPPSIPTIWTRHGAEIARPFADALGPVADAAAAARRAAADGRRGHAAAATPGAAGCRRPGPPRGQRPRNARNRSQGRTGDVGGRRKRVEESGLDSATRDQLLHRVDRAIDDTKKILEQNRPQIELAERNNRVRQEVDRERKYKVEVQEKFALMVNECNKLMEEQRYEEAQVLAKQANELAPDNPVSTQLLWQTKFVATGQGPSPCGTRGKKVSSSRWTTRKRPARRSTT